MFNSNDNKALSGIYHKTKKEYYSFEPSPDVEEIPTFTFENERNLSNYKGRIYNKNALIEQNSKKYLEYIKKFERKKTPLASPYNVFQEITKKNLNNYNIEISNNNNINNINTKSKNTKGEWNENYSNKYFHYNTNNDKEKPLFSSLSAKNIVFDRKNEITNPDLFYKRNNNDYFKYRAEQKKYLDYNYQMMINKKNLHHKKEPNVNPYNPKQEDFEHYKSDLAHNPILNPVNYYSYNKYLEKEIKENNKKYIINNYNYRGLSPFQQVGNQSINN